jgi:hypothetical protein
MLDPRLITDAACHGKGCDDIKIAACKAASGAVKELAYCPLDNCYYVTIDGRERMRSDVPETAYNFFSGPAPE